MRVRGTITYYQPGSAVVLQNGSKSIWIMTQASGPLRIGDQADAIGFPGLHDGFLTLTGGEIQDKQIVQPCEPALRYMDRVGNEPPSLRSRHAPKAKVVAENRNAVQDEYILDSGGNLFSAIYRHPRQEEHRDSTRSRR